MDTLSRRFASAVLFVLYAAFLAFVTVGDGLERGWGRMRRWLARRNLPTAADWPPVPEAPPMPEPPCYWDAPGPWKRARCPKTACLLHGRSPWDCPLPVEVVPK